MTRRIRRRSVLKVAQYGVGLVAIAWVVRQADWGQVVALLLDVPRFVLLTILLVTVGEFVARFSVWYVLIRSVGEADFGSAIHIDLVIRFVNHLFPSRVSGRSLSPLVVRYFTDFSWSRAVAVAAANTGMFALLYGVVAGTGLVLGYPRFSIGITIVVAISTAVYLFFALVIGVAGHRVDVLDGSGAILTALKRLPFVGHRVSDALERAPDFTDETARVFRSLYDDPETWALYGLGWAGMLVVFPGIRVGLLLESFDAGFEPVVLLPVFLVTAYSVTILPLTPGGIGVAEASATAVFVALGVPSEVIVPVVLVDRFLGVYLAAIAGGYPMLNVDFADMASS